MMLRKITQPGGVIAIERQLVQIRRQRLLAHFCRLNIVPLKGMKEFGPDWSKIRSLKPRNAVLYVTHGSRGDTRGSRAPVTLLG